MNDYHSNSTAYGYNALNQLTKMTAPGSKVWDFFHNAIGQPTQENLANGMASFYSSRCGRFPTVCRPPDRQVSSPLPGPATCSRVRSPSHWVPLLFHQSAFLHICDCPITFTKVMSPTNTEAAKNAADAARAAAIPGITVQEADQHQRTGLRNRSNPRHSTTQKASSAMSRCSLDRPRCRS